MATVGERLVSPEAGWKQYDDRDPSFKYEGDSWIHGSTTNRDPNNIGYYKTTFSTTNVAGTLLRFLFKGPSLRIVGRQYPTMGEDHLITIDGVEETFSTRGEEANGTLVYEALNLDINVIHEVTIKVGATGALNLDAFHIDSNGRLLHPDEVLTPAELEIGKRIRAHYTAPTSGQVGVFSGLGEETADFIPPASSATPSGDFYLIMVDEGNGKKKLIADRNVQHSISWDTLNSSGIASGSGLPTYFKKNSLPVFSSPASKEGVSISASHNGDIVYRIADGADGGDNNAEQWYASSKNAWITIDLGVKKLVDSFYYSAYSLSQMPRSINVEGSNTGNFSGEQITLFDNTNLIWNVEGGVTFNFTTPGEYRYYRFNLANPSGNVVIKVTELKLFQKVLTNYAFITRLLTGGISSTDKDNEWDQYIVSSTLNGSISAAGSNEIWNWQGLRSWTSTVMTEGADKRASRGGDSLSAYYINNSFTRSNSTYAGNSFRPVLEIESLIPPPPPPLMKHFIHENGQYKKYLTSLEGDMVVDDTYSGEGTLMRIPLNKLARKVEVT